MGTSERPVGRIRLIFQLTSLYIAKCMNQPAGGAMVKTVHAWLLPRVGILMFRTSESASLTIEWHLARANPAEPSAHLILNVNRRLSRHRAFSRENSWQRKRN